MCQECRIRYEELTEEQKSEVMVRAAASGQAIIDTLRGKIDGLELAAAAGIIRGVIHAQLDEDVVAIVEDMTRRGLEAARRGYEVRGVTLQPEAHIPISFREGSVTRNGRLVDPGADRTRHGPLAGMRRVTRVRH